ncbi:MAG TPA: FadR/GntR family transcriptional regulator [Actinomycetota bacterium]|jgi:GntR family transcriptional repressor for pyruvate dehydrogenase complex
MFEPIERRKVYEQVAERLLTEIADRRLKPGDRLPPERVLAEAYRVGRSSVREALRMLESRGLIRSMGHGAFKVADYGNPLNQSLGLLLSLRDGDLLELYEVRRIMEVEAAGLAAARRTEEDLARMRSAIDEMVLGLSSRERYIGADVDFHLAIARATGNRIASHMMDAVRDVMRRALSSIYSIPGSPERSTEQHRRIFKAISAGEPDEARKQMREHLLRVEGEIRDVLRVRADEAIAAPTTEASSPLEARTEARA